MSGSANLSASRSGTILFRLLEPARKLMCCLGVMRNKIYNKQGNLQQHGEGRTQAAMAQKKRHSRVEIASKLAQANDLATQGKLQSEIARTLGVSVMTLHRWRKAPPGPRPALVATHEAGQPYRMRRGGDRIAELQLENSRLRRLVTDLLLEKIKLEEAAQSQSSIA